MKKVKKLMATGLSMILICALAACGKTQQPAETPAPSTAAAVVEAPTPAAEEEVAMEAPAEASPEAAAAEEQEIIPVDTKENPVLLHPIVTTFHEGGQAPDNRMVYTLEYDQITLPSEEAERYPQLVSELEELNGKLAEAAAQGRSVIEDSYQQGLRAEEDPPFSYEQRISVLRADENFLSVRIESSEWMGQAHPQSAVSAYTYFTLDGIQVTPEDIFVSKKALLEVLTPALKALDAAYFDLEAYLEDYVFTAVPGGDEIAFTVALTGDGAEFVFSPYELAPYADGKQIVYLSYQQHASVFRPGIAAVAQNYAYPVETDREVRTAAGALQVHPKYSSDYMLFDGIVLTLNGQEYAFDTRSYSAVPYVVQCGDRTFLYVWEGEDDDEEYLEVYRLQDGKAEQTGRIGGKKGGRQAAVNEAGQKVQVADLNCYARTNAVQSFTDPMNLKLDDGAVYCPGDDGVPVKK